MNRSCKRTILKIVTAILLVSLCATVPVIAGASDLTVTNYSVGVDGNCNLKFIYNTVADGTEFVATVEGRDPITVKAENNTVSVPLYPYEMTKDVTVYPAGDEAATKTYSVADYAAAVLADAGMATYHNAIRALLNWGAMAEAVKGVTVAANAGIYANGTNPVNGVTAAFGTDDQETVDNEAGANCAMSMTLGANESVLNFKFSNLADGTYTATVKKGEGEAVPAKVEKVGDEYVVTVSNVGVAVYGTAYTVSILKDNAAQMTVKASTLSYLSNIAQSAATNEMKNLAKSLYQLYTLTKGTVPSNCTHTATHWLATKTASTTVVCSTCFTVQDTVFYSNAANIKAQKYQDSLFKYNSAKNQVTFTNTLSEYSEYVRLTGMTVAEGTVKSDKAWTRFNLAARWGTDENDRLVSDVRYLVIKYRMGNTTGDQKLDIYVANRSAAGWNAYQPNAIADAQWHTVVIDLYNANYDGDAADKITHNEDNQTVSFSYLQIQPFGTQRKDDPNSDLGGQDTCPQVGTQSAEAYIDFAYVAACDQYEDLVGIIDQPTYNFNNKTYYTNGIMDGGKELTVELKKDAAALKTSTSFYSVKQANRTAMTAVHKIEEGGFIRLSAPKFPETTLRSDFPYITYNIITDTNAGGGIAKDSAKYVVFKYRIGADNTPVEGATAVNYINCLAGNTQWVSGMNNTKAADTQKIKVTQDGNWHTVVVDLSTFNTYNTGTANLTHFWIEPFIVNSANCYDNQFVSDSKDTTATVKSAWQDGAYMDFAYVAVCDQYEELIGIINQATYDFNGNTYNTADITNTSPAT